MEIKIISFNIWDLPLWFVPKRKERLALIIDYIKASKADIVCLQESFDPSHRRILEAGLKDHYYMTNGLAQARKILFLKQFDKSGGLVIFSKFPIIDSKFIPHNRFFNATIGEIFGRKGVLLMTVQTPSGKLKVINIHLHEESIWFVDKLIRHHQLRRIAGLLNHKDMATVLCGDFNEHNLLKQTTFKKTIEQKGFHNPDSKFLEPSYRVDNQYFNGWFNHPAISKRFDYIFVRHLELLNLRVKSYEREILEPTLSDHDPVSLVLDTQ